VRAPPSLAPQLRTPPPPTAAARGPPPLRLLHTDLPSHLGVARSTGHRAARRPLYFFFQSGARSTTTIVCATRGRRLVAPGLTRAGGAARTVQGRWCRRRRQRFRTPWILFLASLAASQLTGRKRWPAYPESPRPCRADAIWFTVRGWTVFHLPSTPWVAGCRSFLNQQSRFSSGTSHPVAARARSAVGSDGSITLASASLPDTDAPRPAWKSPPTSPRTRGRRLTAEPTVALSQVWSALHARSGREVVPPS